MSKTNAKSKTKQILNKHKKENKKVAHQSGKCNFTVSLGLH